MPWNVEATPTDPEQAIAWFRARLPLPDPAYRALSEEARRRAFFVAGLAQLDMVQEALDALDAALAKGETFEQFKDRLSERIQRAWGGASAHRLRTIFDTNLQSAYGAGRWKAADELRQERPYWGLSVVLDGRTSRICLNLAGVVLPADHPFWNTHIPPLHFRCRTALVTYSAAQAEGRITHARRINPPWRALAARQAERPGARSPGTTTPSCGGPTSEPWLPTPRPGIACGSWQRAAGRPGRTPGTGSSLPGRSTLPLSTAESARWARSRPPFWGKAGPHPWRPTWLRAYWSSKCSPPRPPRSTSACAAR